MTTDISERQHQPKSILKKPRVPPEQRQDDSREAGQEQEDATPSLPGISRQQAARLITLKQKELKPAVPLETYETLSAFPLSPPPPPAPSSSQRFSAAASPSISDRSQFLALIATFSPAEYDDLVDERNCLDKCGYALCPRNRRSYSGEFKLHKNGVAKTADLNKWCSDDCALRALHIRVQLDHPSYTRQNGELKVKVTLRPEKSSTKDAAAVDGGKHSSEQTKANQQNKGTEDGKIQKQQQQHDAMTRNKGEEDQDKKQEEELSQSLSQLQIDREQRSKKNYGALASERNDMGFERVPVTIIEKETTEVAKAPSVPSGAAGGSADAHLMVEGYKIGSKGKKPERQDGGEEDDDSDDDDPFPTVRLEVLNYGQK
ncbi:Rtr1/RPAP2 family-domain-containing protein [Podospora australis]|uniref:RNA polymerase II subunit B1 CTD phosphatase RPAP2 homolog n=1 Tax=Podospora australis TaxID=1536484 RepID=A0AAN6X366_9PEZI|nr:Rtr1/RPAP2 family-domain-containing protein [Podospora australis]